MPEMPLDKEIWGGPVHLRTPQSSYTSQFQNPAQVLWQTKVDRDAFQDSQIEQLVTIEMMDSVEYQTGEFPTQD
jgi:hypothetical protein